MRRPPDINVMAAAAAKAARGLVRDFGEVENLQVSRKGPADFVSTADLRAEKTLAEELGRARPNFGFLMEESGEKPGIETDSRWIVDPLDGTSNFLHGVPHWAISIAVEQRGEITAGIVYDPIKDELFWAVRNGGAFVNNRRLRVSARNKLRESMVATGMPYHGYGDHTRYMAQLSAIMPEAASVRRQGAASLDLSYVAAGRYEAFWENGLKPWDVAAGVLIVREAGGWVSEADGGKNPVYGPSILAANTEIHPQMVAVLGTVKA